MGKNGVEAKMYPSVPFWLPKLKHNTFMKIKGGYYIKARCIQNSAIATAPPHVREIWDWILKECNHEDRKTSGKIIKRGQCLRSYSDIRDGLHWMVGWRKMTYSKNACETAMNMLKKHTMIHTQKTTRGMVITVLNYDKYQDPSNYDAYKETYRKHTVDIQTADTINKNEKNEKNDKEEILTIPPSGEIVKLEEKVLDPIGQVMDIFYKQVNPALNWGNKTSREAAEWMVKKFGLDNCKRMVEMVCSIQGKPYAPTVTTPYQMKLKLAELKIYFDKEKNTKQSNFKIL